MKQLLFFVFLLFPLFSAADEYIPKRISHRGIFDSITIESRDLFIGAQQRKNILQITGFVKGKKKFNYLLKNMPQGDLLETDEKDFVLIGSLLDEQCILSTLNIATGTVKRNLTVPHNPGRTTCDWQDRLFTLTQDGGAAELILNSPGYAENDTAGVTSVDLTYTYRNETRILTLPKDFYAPTNDYTSTSITLAQGRDTNDLVVFTIGTLLVLDRSTGLTRFTTKVSDTIAGGTIDSFDDVKDDSLIFTCSDKNQKEFLLSVDDQTGKGTFHYKTNNELRAEQKKDRGRNIRGEMSCSVANKYHYEDGEPSSIMRDGNAYSYYYYLKRRRTVIKNPFCLRWVFSATDSCAPFFSKPNKITSTNRVGEIFPSGGLPAPMSCSFKLKISRADAKPVGAMDLQLDNQYGKSSAVHVSSSGETVFRTDINYNDICEGPTLTGPNGRKDLLPSTAYIWAENCG